MSTPIVFTRGEILSFQIQSPNFYVTVTAACYAQVNGVEIYTARITRVIAPFAQCERIIL
jgi:uncharacterized membrane protein